MIDLEQKIRERAYEIWEQEGRFHGRDQEHWHLAKLELTSSAVEAEAAPIEAPVVAAEPAKKKGRRSAKDAVPAVPVAAAAAPRRRRTAPTLQ